MQEKIKYNKKSTTYEEQISLLKERGMIFDDESKALHLLEFISYYRLSGYWFQYYNNFEEKKFVMPINFETIFQIYCFDRELRKILLSEIEKIEVAFRAIISYYWAHKENGFWYLNENNFENKVQYTKIVIKVKKEFITSNNLLFIESFKNKYSDELPPTWILLEIITMGTLSRLFKNMKHYDKKMIANKFNANKTVLESWLHSLVYIRNLCAHHSRLYNVELRIKPNHFIDKSHLFPEENSKVYAGICVIKYLLNKINPNNLFKSKLEVLFNEYSVIDPHQLGFENEWYSKELWENI